jgi:hypothetical protein
MADSCCAEIDIGGPIPRAFLPELIRAVAAFGLRLEYYGGPRATVALLERALRPGAVVCLYSEDVPEGRFDALEEFLVAHRIHFCRTCEAYGECNAELVLYRGEDEPTVFDVDQQGNIILSHEAVVAILGNRFMDNDAKVEAIRCLVDLPATEALTPVRFV